ncbi:hypothetical protein TNCV_871501 [Trichonephila clavipes]|nr:hypothetical protein TNCV_871501 [Trichonephila clavipes]
MMWNGKLLIFVCAVFVWQFAHIRPDLNLQEDGERKDFLDERSIDDLTEDFANDPPLRAEPPEVPSKKRNSTKFGMETLMKWETGGFSGRRKREKLRENGVYVRFKVDRTTSKRIRYGFITVKSTTLIGHNSPRKNTTLPAISSSNSPVVISPSTRRLPVMNDCPRLEEKKNDNSPVVLLTGTHRLLVTNGCPRLDRRGKKRCLERPNLGETLA